ncbi:hypothetical protein ACJX0J_019239, partial [Zea mays]
YHDAHRFTRLFTQSNSTFIEIITCCLLQPLTYMFTSIKTIGTNVLDPQNNLSLRICHMFSPPLLMKQQQNLNEHVDVKASIYLYVQRRLETKTQREKGPEGGLTLSDKPIKPDGAGAVLMKRYAVIVPTSYKGN